MRFFVRLLFTEKISNFSTYRSLLKSFVMSFKYLSLGNVKKIINSTKTSQPKSPERRKFIKTMGFGIIGVNPIVETFNAYTPKKFDVVYNQQSFSIIRNGKIVWEINPNYFGENIRLDVKRTKTTSI